MKGWGLHQLVGFSPPCATHSKKVQQMHAEIFAIGSELTSGAKLDTNSQWLSLRLAELGIPVLFHTTVADDLEANIESLRIAAQRVDLILLTGGLGPTLDDLTRHALAGLLGVQLAVDDDSMQHLESFFQVRGREMPERNRIQALFPLGAVPLSNPVGTAPGIWCELPRTGRPPCLIAAMPGVPSEMYKMFLEQVQPRLTGGEIVIRRARINCFGLGESATEEILGELTARGSDPEVGITAHEATITLRINAVGRSEQDCQTKIVRVSEIIRHKLGTYVFGVEDEELEDVVIRELQRTGRSLTTVEYATAGQLAQRLACVGDAADCYRGGSVGVLPQLDLAEEGHNRLQQTGADYLLAVGTEAVRTNESGRLISEIPLLLIGPEGEQQQLLVWTGNPAITRSRTAKSALDLLRHQLRGVSSR